MTDAPETKELARGAAELLFRHEEHKEHEGEKARFARNIALCSSW
jgi:hypothetical protein